LINQQEFIICLGLGALNMSERKADRRVGKTRRLLRHALAQLMTEKRVQDITVRELTDLCDLNRGTFYPL
jgi:AcrR family transcriptional regulator